MPKKTSKPKRRRTGPRTSLRPAPIFVILLMANVAAGLVASPLTVIRKVQVEGVAPWDRPRIESVFTRQLKGVPCALINRYHYESLIMEDPAIESVRLDRNIFGSAVLTVAYHVPVARFYNHLGMALSEDGVVFRSSHVPNDLPTLEVFAGGFNTYLTFANDFPALVVAHLAQRVKAIFPDRAVRIQYGTGSSLCLNIGTTQVILGSCDGLDGKLGKLQDKLKSDQDFLSRVKTFNLLDPTNPMTVPR